MYVRVATTHYYTPFWVLGVLGLCGQWPQLLYVAVSRPRVHDPYYVPGGTMEYYTELIDRK